ncbi:MAG: DUF4203 domain-containing protein [Syntrophales bacterium]|nr:DUF4203 domain-containing protein [Syntrophales bacterium]MDD5640502.1 DUF4203 domain-containing protein [Syntrophales bacterium]
MDTWFGIGAILVGLASCFYGYPLFRIFLILSGLIYGYGLGHAWIPASHPGFSLVIALAAAVIMAVLAYPLWSIGVIIVGVVLGFTIMVSLGLALNLSQTVLILLGVGGGVAVGLLFYQVRDLFVMLTTAFNGAALVVLGLGWHFPVLAFGGGRANLPNLVIMVVLGAFGFAVQYGMFKERRTYSN